MRLVMASQLLFGLIPGWG
ncbi:hypothetical protein A2U01_0074459, partial [Trifolium medium]|nr:hypothetical protein [Trifolium medium]